VKGSIQSVEVVYLVHATEDPGKIEDAVSKLLGRRVVPETERLEGHFGNEIVKAKVHLTGEEAGSAFKSVIGAIPDGLRREIASNIGLYMDEHSAIFLRLDKQGLVSGSMALGSGDSVRVKVKPRAFLLKEGGTQFYLQHLRSA
jgi:RNA binding exosome subunit